LDGIEAVALITPETDREAIREVLGGQEVSWVDPVEDFENRPIWRRGRKWATSSWRGGVNQASVLDEWGHPLEYLHALRMHEADYCFKPSVYNPILDVELAVKMLAHLREEPKEFLLTRAPPGFGYEIYRRDMLEEIGKYGVDLRFILALFLDRTNRDATMTEMFFELDEEVIASRHRISADTRRGLSLVRELERRIEAGSLSASVLDIQKILHAEPELWAGRIPRELEIEITGRDPRKRSQRPRPRRDRPDMSLDLFRKIVEEAGSLEDDVLLTLGGFGDPFEHPDLVECVRIARDAGIFGIHVATSGLGLDGDRVQELIDARVDLFGIQLDAFEAETYKALHGEDRLSEIQAGVEGIIDRINQVSQEYRPLIVPEMIRRAETIGDQEAFFDFWLRKVGWVVLRGYNEYCGAREDLDVLPLTFSNREPCVRIAESMFVCCTGEVPVCSQDYLVAHPVGNLQHQSLEEIWTGETLRELRAGHSQGRYDGQAICESCRYWHQIGA
jgi:spiro-SPASM protein